MKLALSVIVCTHNPRPDYLRRALDALRAQTLAMDQWELILIDNCSDTPIEERFDLSWHPDGRHVREAELGLTPARLRGIREAKGEYLVFVDDDNLLAPDYCEVLLQLRERFAQIGCFGAGVIEPEFEVVPQPDVEPYLPSLALRSAEKAAWSNNPQDRVIPWGAGLAVHRDVAACYLNTVAGCPIRRRLDRSGSSLVSGGDEEFSWVACESGYGKGLFPELKVTHLIAARRVEKDYILRLAEGQAFSGTLLAHIHGGQINSPKRSIFADILYNILRARVSVALYHANSWWGSRHKSAMERTFDNAWRSGVELALRQLAEMEQGQSNSGDLSSSRLHA